MILSKLIREALTNNKSGKELLKKTILRNKNPYTSSIKKDFILKVPNNIETKEQKLEWAVNNLDQAKLPTGRESFIVPKHKKTVQDSRIIKEFNDVNPQTQLSPQENFIKNTYERGYDKDYNTLARKGYLEDLDESVNTDSYIDALQKGTEALNKAIQKSKITKETIVTRGLSDFITTNKIPFSKLKPGDIYEESGFTSTSIPRGSRELEPSSELTMDIILPKDKQSFLNVGMGKSPEFQKEREILLPKGLKYKLEEITDKGIRRFSIVNPYTTGALIAGVGSTQFKKGGRTLTLKKSVLKHQNGANNSLGEDWNPQGVDSNVLSEEELNKLIEYRTKQEQKSIENNDVDNAAWSSSPINEPVEYDKLTDEEYFYVTGVDRRLEGRSPETAKTDISKIAPKIKLTEDFYKNIGNYNNAVDTEYNSLKEASLPNTDSNYKKDLGYTSDYVQWEYDGDVLPHIENLQQQEKESYTPKAEEYIAQTLKDLGFNAEKLAGRAKLTRDELYDNLKPEIVEILKSKGLSLDKVNWDKVAKYSDKKYSKRLDKVIKVANSNPLLPKASPKMIENKLIGILEKGRYKDPYEGLEENQIKVAEGLNGKIDESVRQDIIKDMKRGKSNQELLEKYKGDLAHINVSSIKFKLGGRLKIKFKYN